MIGADDDQRSHGSVKNLGVVANLLLLVGDFATTGTRSAFVASLVASGYMLLIVWFAWISWSLISRTSSGPAPRSG